MGVENDSNKSQYQTPHHHPPQYHPYALSICNLPAFISANSHRREDRRRPPLIYSPNPRGWGQFVFESNPRGWGRFVSETNPRGWGQSVLHPNPRIPDLFCYLVALPNWASNKGYDTNLVSAGTALRESSLARQNLPRTQSPA